ncbi:hypothetical protein DIPPA_29562 [Diplonema papillatum]|nr:hypothetical protein DIPPA_29562 [Diplonema papillatum]
MVNSVLFADPTDIVVGRPRPKKNPLIYRDEVGRSRTAGLSPHASDPDFTYGMACKRDPETAGEVALTWMVHKRSIKPQDCTAKDFVRMNKTAISHQCLTSKDARALRSDLNYRVAQMKFRKPKNDVPRSKLESVTFGAKSKHDESVKDLMGNRYALEWVQERMRAESTRKAAETDGKREVHRRPFIHAPALSALEADPPKPPFVMKRFRSVLPRVTCRTPSPMRPPTIELPPISATPEPLVTGLIDSE